MEKERIFWNNLRVLLNKRKIDIENFAIQTGCRSQDIRKIIDGRLFLFAKEKEQIAKKLGVSVKSLLERKEDKIYEDAGCFECVGEFSDQKSKNVYLIYLICIAILKKQ